MTDRTQARMLEIWRRTRKIQAQRERRSIFALRLCSLLLLAGIGIFLYRVQHPGVSQVGGAYGTVLLRGEVGMYMTVGVAAFVLGVALTIACIQLRKKQKHEESEEDT